jgi:hypothetical protein
VAYLADVLLAAGSLGAALYCFVLSRRLRQFNQLEGGMGGAIAALSVRVDDMTKALTLAQAAAGKSAGDLEALTTRAETSARQIELLLASLHDLPEPPESRLRVSHRRRTTMAAGAAQDA